MGTSSRLAYSRWLVRPAWAAVLLVGLLVGSLLLGLPGGGIGGPAVAVAYPCADPSECAVAVRFTGPVDREQVARSLQVDPPVPFTVAWQGDMLLIKAAEPLRAAAGYTLSIQVAGSTSAATPVAVRFVAGGVGSPVALASAPATTPPAMTGAVPSVAPLVVVASPSPTPTTSAIAASSAETAAISCAVQPVRGFGTLYQNQPAVAARLGCARGPEYGVPMVSQSFQGGRLFWRGDRKEILALLESGRWHRYQDTFDGTETATPAAGEPLRGLGKLWREQPDLRGALGAATAPELPIGAVVEEFDRGLLLWTADRVIFALSADGAWERYADSYRDETAVATSPAPAVPTPIGVVESPASTVVPTPTLPAAGPPRSPTVAATPVVPDCPVQPVRGFGLAYRQQPAVAARLGCARAAEIGVQVARQSFERGVLVWRADTREIIVIRGDGTWSSHPDTWQDGEALAAVANVPTGRLAPERGFGKLWRQQPNVRQALGWATAAEQPLSGTVEDFTGGRMLWTADRVIYVLYPDATWQSFADQFAE